MSKRRNRKARERKSIESPIVNSHAAGIDIAASADHYVAVPSVKGQASVKHFGGFTDDLHLLADWLESCRIETVAMESTGVYWIPVFQVLEARGMKVHLVNSKHIKNVPGRKSDVMDCQWLQYLHSVGLLRGSFRPEAEICAARSVLRHRAELVQLAASHVQRMQKSLDQMNLKLHYVISDITGETGLRIIEAILGGRRDPAELAKLKSRRIKASESVLAKALRGEYLEEHIFTLDQSLSCYLNYIKMIEQCDERIARMLAAMDSKVDPQERPLPPKAKKKGSKEPDPTMRRELYRILGVDLTSIDGVSAQTAHTFLSEVGPDVSKFPSEGHFVSWLGLCPGSHSSAGKHLSRRTRKVANRLSTALRMCAQGLHHAKSALGDFYRRMRARLGAPKAITATASKIARIMYAMLKSHRPYDETIFARNEEVYQNKRRRNLRRQAKELGMELIDIQ